MIARCFRPAYISSAPVLNLFVRSLSRTSRSALGRRSNSTLQRQANRYPFGALIAASCIGYVGGFASVAGAGILFYSSCDLASSLLCIGYGIYHFSGMKNKVDTIPLAISWLNQAGIVLSADRPAPNQALNYLRQGVKTYVAYIPGSGFVVDKLFDHVDQVVDEHAEEANEIVGRAIWEITQIVSQGHSALEILAVCKRLGQDLGSLGGKASKPLIDSLDLDKKTQVIVKNIKSHVETIQTKAPQWKADLNKAAEPIGSAIGNFVGTLNINRKNQVD